MEEPGSGRANNPFVLSLSKHGLAQCSESGEALSRKLPGGRSRTIRTEPTDFKFHVPDCEAVLILQSFFETVNVRTAKLDDFLARNTDEVVMFPITGSFEVAVVLL